MVGRIQLGLLGVLLATGCGEGALDPVDTGAPPGPSDAGPRDVAIGGDAGIGPTDATAIGDSGALAPDATPQDGGEVPDAEPRRQGAIFFAPDVLHQVDIQVDGAYLDQLDNDTQTRVPCTITYDGQVVQNAGIRKKGQTSLRPLADKPSFSVKLDELVMGADIDGVEKFALNNTLQDPTYLNEALTYPLFQRAGIPAPRAAHAVVRFNGEVKGVYLVIEATNKEFLRHHYGDGNGNLYEGPWDFTQALAAADLKDEEEGRTRDDLGALRAAVLDEAADRAATLPLLLDVEEALVNVAVEMAFCLWDGYTVAAWNFYLYHVPAGSPSPSADRFVLLPHGADWPYWIRDLDPLDPDFRPWGDPYPPGYLAMVLTAPPFDMRYLDALRDVRDRAYDLASMLARIDQVEALLHTADRSVPVLDQTVRDFDDHVDEARAFVGDRYTFLLAY